MTTITDTIIEAIETNPEFDQKMIRQADPEEKMRGMGMSGNQ